MNRYFIGAILWALFILVLTLTPGKSMPNVGLFDYDKLGHAGIFGILSFLIVTGFYKRNENPNRLMKIVIIGLVASVSYGIIIEFIQQFIPGRGLEWYDALANTVGSILGICLFYIWYKLKLGSKT